VSSLSKNALIVGALVVVLLLGGFLILSQNKSTTPTTPTATQQQEPVLTKASIEIKDFKYSPATLTVKKGEKITVTNKDVAGHSVTSDEEGLFDSEVLGKDETREITAPSELGEYPFHCTPHPQIKGTLIVE